MAHTACVRACACVCVCVWLFAGGLLSYLRYLCLLAHRGVHYVLTICVGWRVSYRKQEQLTLRELLFVSFVLPIF